MQVDVTAQVYSLSLLKSRRDKGGNILYIATSLKGRHFVSSDTLMKLNLQSLMKPSGNVYCNRTEP